MKTVLTKLKKPRRPKLGQMIQATDRLERVQRNTHGGVVKIWTRWGDVPAFRARPVQGVFMGYRTRSNGRIEYNREYTAWYPSDYFEVWLIVVNRRENPVLVLPADVADWPWL